MRLLPTLLPTFLLVCHSLAAAPRSAPWTPTQLPGSARLCLEDLKQVVVPKAAGAKLLAAVQDLQTVFGDQLVGSELSVSSEGSANAKQSIVLHLSEPKDSTGSFRITRERSRVVIRAASQEGLSNGIYALCGDVLGARWYWPSDLGLEYIGSVPDKFPEQRWLEQPSFIQRALHPVDTDFGRRNRLSRPFQFNHALGQVFTPKLYETNPEVFPIVKGRKRVPKGNNGTDPQPNFAHPDAVEIAAAAAQRYFEKNPRSLSFSLSINDNVLFDESKLTQRQVTPLKYFRTRPDYTDYVFTFMNAVATMVFDEEGMWQNENGEDRYLTALAYYWTEPAPTISIHPRVMPVLTSDRAQWHDPEYRAEDKVLIEGWADSGAERIATWDYYFGAPYPYPRQFNQWMIESLQHLQAEGVDVFYSQLPSAWGLDGAKAWLASKLLWDTKQDSGALLDEYYTHFFGAAAEPMRAFYEAAEAHRNANAGKADWIKFYKDEAGVGLFPSSVLAQLRGLIESARAAVQDDPRRLARVKIVSEAYTFTEAYAVFHQARENLIEGCLERSTDLAQRLDSFHLARAEYKATAASIIAMPMHKRLNTFSRQIQSDPSALANVILAQMARLEVEEDVYGLSAWVDDDETFRSTFTNIELSHDGRYELSFQGPELPRVTDWHFDFRPNQNLQVFGAEGTGSGIRVSGADILSIFRDEPVSAERSYLLDTKIAWKISPDNRTQIKLIWTDRNGKHLRTDLPLQLPWGDSNGTQHLIVPFKSPKRAYDVRIHFTTSRQYPGDFLELQKVDFGALYPKHRDH